MACIEGSTIRTAGNDRILALTGAPSSKPAKEPDVGSPNEVGSDARASPGPSSPRIPPGVPDPADFLARFFVGDVDAPALLTLPCAPPVADIRPGKKKNSMEQKTTKKS